MSEGPTKNLPASIKQRLLNYARQNGLDFNALLIRFAMERFLFRLSASPYAEKFYLKGAMLFVMWENAAHRPTKDLDLLFLPQHDSDELVSIFEEIAAVEVLDDGIQIVADSIQAVQIREENSYGGLRIQLVCLLGEIKIPMQIDVGLGDSVYPETERSAFPSLLDFDVPKIRAYPAETVIAEKLQAIVELGMRNSRLKDYYDIYYLSQQFSFDAYDLKEAIKQTFRRRNTALPQVCPSGLSDRFSSDESKQTQWKAFIRKNQLKAPEMIGEIVAKIQSFVLPLLLESPEDGLSWIPGKGWASRKENTTDK